MFKYQTYLGESSGLKEADYPEEEEEEVEEEEYPWSQPGILGNKII